MMALGWGLSPSASGDMVRLGTGDGTELGCLARDDAGEGGRPGPRHGVAMYTCVCVCVCAECVRACVSAVVREAKYRKL